MSAPHLVACRIEVATKLQPLAHVGSCDKRPAPCGLPVPPALAGQPQGPSHSSQQQEQGSCGHQEHEAHNSPGPCLHAWVVLSAKPRWLPARREYTEAGDWVLCFASSSKNSSPSALLPWHMQTAAMQCNAVQTDTPLQNAMMHLHDSMQQFINAAVSRDIYRDVCMLSAFQVLTVQHFDPPAHALLA